MKIRDPVLEKVIRMELCRENDSETRRKFQRDR